MTWYLCDPCLWGDCEKAPDHDQDCVCWSATHPERLNINQPSD